MDTSAVSRYAQALLDAAAARSDEEAVETDLIDLSEALESSGLRAFWKNPSLTDAVKCEAMDKLGSKLQNDLTVRFLKLLIRKKRTEIMSEVSHEYTKLLRKKRGIRTCEITLAEEADSKLKTLIEDRLKSILGAKIVTEYSVRPDLIGGIRVKTDDRILDASFKSRISEIKKSLLAAKIY